MCDNLPAEGVTDRRVRGTCCARSDRSRWLRQRALSRIRARHESWVSNHNLARGPRSLLPRIDTPLAVTKRGLKTGRR
jgi:hypothetical protein